MRNFARSRRVLPNGNGQSPWTGQGFVSPQEPKRAASEEWDWVRYVLFASSWCSYIYLKLYLYCYMKGLQPEWCKQHDNSFLDN